VSGDRPGLGERPHDTVAGGVPGWAALPYHQGTGGGVELQIGVGRRTVGNWVCDRLTDRQLRALRAYSARHLDMVNHRVEHPGPVAALT
jgi:hypothetical protein